MEFESRQLPQKSMNIIQQAMDDYAKQVYGDKYGQLNDKQTQMYFPDGKREIKYDADIASGLFSISNAKLADDATLIINFTSALGCPSMNDCPITQKACYAVAGENRLPDTRRKNLIVQNLVAHAQKNNMLDGLFDIAELYIVEALKTKKPIKYIRYNEVGDFPNQSTLIKAAKFSQKVKKQYNIISMAYTSKKGIDPTEIVNGEPIDMIMAINRSRNDIPKSENAIDRNYFGIPMGNFSSNPNINLQDSYCDVEYVTDGDVNKLKVTTPIKDEHGSPSIPILNKGTWQGGSGYYYVCPCSFWQYNKDKAIHQFAIKQNVIDENYPIPQNRQDREKIRSLLNDEQNKQLKTLLNKIKSPCGIKCSVCHDTHGGIYQNEKNIKNYAVLAATHGATASNYDNEYATEKRKGNDNVIYKGNKNNKTGRETKYIQKYKTNAPIKSDVFDRNTNENIMKKQIIRLTENDLHNIIKSCINEVSLSYEKKKIINKIHKITQPLTAKLYKDENWEGVKNICQTINNLIQNDGELNVWVDNGGYWKQMGEFPNYKEYKFQIIMNNGIEINGSIKCHAAGNMEDTFQKYDMTINMW